MNPESLCACGHLRSAHYNQRGRCNARRFGPGVPGDCFCTRFKIPMPPINSPTPKARASEWPLKCVVARNDHGSYRLHTLTCGHVVARSPRYGNPHRMRCKDCHLHG